MSVPPAAREVSGSRGGVTTGDGRRLSYLEWGVPDRPPLLLLHGGNSAAADWQDFARAFADQYRIIAPDLRGRGFSDWDPLQDYTVAATVNDVEFLRAHLGLNRVVLAGHSFGAVVALVYAPREPDRVDRLVLLDGGPVPERTAAERPAGLADVPLQFPSWDAALAYQRARHAAIPDELHLRLADNHFVRQADGSVAWRSDLVGQVQWARAGDPLMADQWPFVVGLRCATLVVRGGASPVFRANITDRMIQLNAHIRVVEIPGAGHGVHHERPAEVITAVRQFLTT